MGITTSYNYENKKEQNTTEQNDVDFHLVDNMEAIATLLNN